MTGCPSLASERPGRAERPPETRTPQKRSSGLSEAFPLFAQHPESPRDRQFAEFHAANPQVFDLFRSLAVKALESGGRVGARCIGERIRWEYAVEVSGRAEGSPKFNDHLWPRYARLLAATDGRFTNFFETRDGGMQGGAA